MNQNFQIPWKVRESEFKMKLVGMMQMKTLLEIDFKWKLCLKLISKQEVTNVFKFGEGVEWINGKQKISHII